MALPVSGIVMLPFIGNVFLFLVAGYETTAHTLAYAFILLALHQEEQEAIYQNIKSALPADRKPVRPPFAHAVCFY